MSSPQSGAEPTDSRKGADRADKEVRPDPSAAGGGGVGRGPGPGDSGSGVRPVSPGGLGADASAEQANRTAFRSVGFHFRLGSGVDSHGGGKTGGEWRRGGGRQLVV